MTVEEQVREYFSDIPVMVPIAKCESTFRHIDNQTGEPLRGYVNNSDVGVMQINEYYHRQAAENLGYDIYTIKGNMQYARYLYQEQGTQPWQASEKCWSQNIEEPIYY